MLKNLPIIPSQSSQNFTHYSYFYSIVSMISQCRIDYYIIDIITDCFNRIFDCLLEYLERLQTRWQGTASIWEVQALPGMPLFETNASCISHISAILVSDYSYFMLVHGL